MASCCWLSIPLFFFFIVIPLISSARLIVLSLSAIGLALEWFVRNIIEAVLFEVYWLTLHETSIEIVQQSKAGKKKR